MHLITHKKLKTQTSVTKLSTPTLSMDLSIQLVLCVIALIGSTIATSITKATQFYSVLIYYWRKILYIVIDIHPYCSEITNCVYSNYC